MLLASYVGALAHRCPSTAGAPERRSPPIRGVSERSRLRVWVVLKTWSSRQMRDAFTKVCPARKESEANVDERTSPRSDPGRVSAPATAVPGGRVVRARRTFPFFYAGGSLRLQESGSIAIKMVEGASSMIVLGPYWNISCA